MGLIRVLVLTWGSESHASSRIRALDYLPLFNKQGRMVFRWIPRVPERRTVVQKLASPFIKRYLLTKRALAICCGRYDFLFIQRWFLPAWLLKVLEIRGIPFLYDFDDAIYLNTPKQPRNQRNTLRMISGATKVVVSSPVLVSWCREAGIAATMITTPVDSPVIRRKKDYRRSGPLTIGWIGSSYTTPYLKLILPALKALRPRIDLRLLLIGADPGFDSEGIPVTLYPWNQANERSLLCQMDVGVMPLPDAPWAEGKGGYKIFLYMAAALPVIASPVGINRDIVDHGKNGYLAGNQAEWEKSFWLLGNDPLLCQKMGAEGSRLVQSRYDRQQCFVELSRCFDFCLDAEK